MLLNGLSRGFVQDMEHRSIFMFIFVNVVKNVELLRKKEFWGELRNIAFSGLNMIRLGRL
jgi:hypothetical protein